jgi:hypothetical protein
MSTDKEDMIELSLDTISRGEIDDKDTDTES